MELTNPNTIQALLKKHEISAKKFFGQNFLVNPQILAKIVETAEITPEDHILEVGPGLGVLTQQLAKYAKKVTSIELDQGLFPVLKETLAGLDNIELIHADALNFAPPTTPYKVVANIPYNITSPLMTHFLHNDNPPTTMTILMQKEVAEKICQGTPDMTVLSLSILLFGEPTFIAKVPADSFLPAPKVQSAILHIKSKPNVDHEKALAILNLAKRAFRGRRKKLSNTLADMKDKLQKLGLAEKRPQHLTIEDWGNLI